LILTSIAEALRDAAARLAAAGVDDARIEADALLAHAIGCDRAHLLARLRDPLDAANVRAFQALIGRRMRREPLAYITGEREFYGVSIACAPDALIPRPETELLVDVALEALRGRTAVRAADVGTGTGAVAVAIALHAPGAVIEAVDASDEALAVAARNVGRHGLSERVRTRAGDLLAGLGLFDVIVANLPYVDAREWASLQPEVRDYEPREALVADDDGCALIERLLAQAPQHTERGATVAVEIGFAQAERIAACALSHFPAADVTVIKDLAGIDRVVRVGL
jgi:release factor glutamine methyltransferase